MKNVMIVVLLVTLVAYIVLGIKWLKQIVKPTKQSDEDKCKYGENCMCQSCKYQTHEVGTGFCYVCADCDREDKQVHDIRNCTKYERRGGGGGA